MSSTAPLTDTNHVPPNKRHATLILAKDTELFSRGRHIKKIITDEDVSVPSLDDVRAAMAAEATAAMAAESAAAMAAESTAP
ncbi:hypothetical protein MJO29_014274 [Puccinia striiformis f. sp. tritici]|nr:hypothetical protein MJO29_014274 [Puccinia striiformis f. sp. tritici]KAI9628458.1 hypothetical protein H4Q26_018059 [Puccinia striiformis f. sp. tritici PST-130]